MTNNGAEKKKSTLRAVTAERLTEMLKDIDVSAGKVKDGAYSARARITALFDRGTFSEVGAYINRSRSSNPDEFSGVICGYGAIGGKLAFAFVQDRARMGGAFGRYSALKIISLYEMAQKNGAPIIGIFDSDGVSVYEGVRALAGLGNTLGASARAAGAIPRIALIPGVCGGNMAVLASGFDFVISTAPGDKTGSEIFAISPFVNGVTVTAETGFTSYEAKDEADLYVTARKLLEYLPSNNAEGAVVCDGDLSAKPDIEGLTGEALIAALADNKNYLRLWSRYAPGLAAGFAVVGGVSCAFIVNDRTYKNGALTPEACRVVARIERFADRFGIPLISLVDCPGFDTEEVNDAEYIYAAADLIDAMQNSTNAKISAVVGKAYGPGFVYMASKSCGGDIAFATPDSCISALSPEASVALLWNDRIRAADLSASREVLEREWRDQYASPNEAALCGEIDDIVPINEIRPRIASALQMLLGKSTLSQKAKK